MKIIGVVAYQNLGPGFWGIIDIENNEWRPVNMPEQLKVEGATVFIRGHEVDEMSMFMWGRAIKITSFETVKSD